MHTDRQFPHDDGRWTTCIICDAPMYRYEVKQHELACVAIIEEAEQTKQTPEEWRFARRRKAALQ